MRWRQPARDPSGAGVHAHRPGAAPDGTIPRRRSQRWSTSSPGKCYRSGAGRNRCSRRRHRRDPPRAQPRDAGRCDRRQMWTDRRVLSGDDEARLAFVGAAGTLGHAPAGELGVVDVGGGSSELVVGTAPDKVSWCTSFGVGSADLADSCLPSDPFDQRVVGGAGAGRAGARRATARTRSRQSQSAAARLRCDGSPVRCSTPTRSGARSSCSRANVAPRSRAGSRSISIASGCCRPGW